MSISNDQIACGTSTTGTGTITLAAPPTGINAADPYAAFSGSGFGTTTGVPISYSIVEYTDSTFTKPKQSESGRGTLNIGASLTATTLARTTPLQSATSMDSQPATVTGQVAAPSAITIGTAANVVVWFGTLSWLFSEAMPYFSTSGVTNGDALGHAPFQRVVANGTNFVVSHQQITYQRVCLGFSGLIKSATIWLSAGYTPGTQSLKMGLYELASDGRPGKLLIDFGTTSTLTSGAMTQTAAAAVWIRAGYYYLAVLTQFTGGSGTPAIRACDSVAPSPLGTNNASGSENGPIARATVASQTALSDPATLTSLTSVASTNEFACAFKST